MHAIQALRNGYDDFISVDKVQHLLNIKTMSPDDLSILQRAYDEVVNSIWLLPMLMPLEVIEDGDSHLINVHSLIDGEIQISLKALAGIEYPLPIKEKIPLDRPASFSSLRLVGSLSKEDIGEGKVYVDGNLILLNGLGSFLAIGYMLPHLFCYKLEIEVYAKYNISEVVSKQGLMVNPEIFPMVMIKYRALKYLENRDVETFTSYEHLGYNVINLYNAQRERQLAHLSSLREPKNVKL